MNIKIPKIIWSLGDREQPINSTIVIRPLYYNPKGVGPRIRVGDVNPDYAEPLMKVLSKVQK